MITVRGFGTPSRRLRKVQILSRPCRPTKIGFHVWVSTTAKQVLMLALRFALVLGTRFCGHGHLKMVNYIHGNQFQSGARSIYPRWYSGEKDSWLLMASSLYGDTTNAVSEMNMSWHRPQSTVRCVCVCERERLRAPDETESRVYIKLQNPSIVES